MEMGEGRVLPLAEGLCCKLAFPCIAVKKESNMALALKRKPLEVTVLSVLVTLRHTVPFRPLCVMWSCKVGVGYPYVFILL